MSDQHLDKHSDQFDRLNEEIIAGLKRCRDMVEECRGRMADLTVDDRAACADNDDDASSD